MRSVVLVLALVSLVVLVLSVAHTREVAAASIAFRDGLAFAGDESKPFSGRVIERYDDGRIKTRQSFIGGRAEGLLRSWHRNGQPWIVGSYRRGLENGQVRSWSPSGELWFEKEYRDGVLVGCRGYWEGELEPDSFWCRW
jgi:antitoxin component YwqK of YwqJK toxin-antitoxin module